MRIAFCHYTSDIFGGSDRSLFDLATHLPKDRFEPLMILKRDDPMVPKYAAAAIPVHEVRLVSPRRALEWGKLAAYFLAFAPSVLRVAWRIRRFRADVVHVNTLYNLVGPAAAVLARRPLVWHVREMADDSRAGRIMLKMVARLATRAVAISAAVGGTLEGCGDRLRVVPNGIDLSEYENLPERDAAKRTLGFAPNQPLVTVVGRLEFWKGQHVFIEAVPAIAKEHPDARFLIVGGPAVNKPEYEAQLRDRCRELGVAGQVAFLGIRHDIPAILAASNILVLPSATPEPFGRTVVEAMAAKCPVVATAAGGPLEIVKDGETGFLVPPNDPAALAEKVNLLLSDPALAKRFGENGRARATACYSLARLVEDMAGIFEEGKKGKRGKGEKRGKCLDRAGARRRNLHNYHKK